MQSHVLSTGDKAFQNITEKGKQSLESAFHSFLYNTSKPFKMTLSF